MRRVDFKFVGLWAVGLALLVVGAHFWHDFQVRRFSVILRDQADDLLKQHKAFEAVGYLQRYVLLAPDDTEALAKLGMTMADLPRGAGKALFILDQVLRREPERYDVRLRVARLCIGLRRYTDAREHLLTGEHNLLKKSPRNGELYLLLGQCHEAEHKFEQQGKDKDDPEAPLLAKECYAKAIRLEPARVETYVRLARLLHRRLNQPDDAAQVMDQLVEQNDKSADAWLARCQFRRELGFVELAVEDAAMAMRLAPDNPATVFAAAECALAAGELKQARRHAAEGIRRFPRDARFYLSLAAVENQSKEHAKALASIRLGLARLPDNADLLWNLTNQLVDDNALAEAAPRIEQLRKAEYPAAPMAFLDARVQLQRQKWFEGASLLEQVRSALVEWPDLAKQANFWLGQAYEQMGDQDLELAAFRRAVAVGPLWAPANLRLAAALARTGRLDEALDRYLQVMGQPGAPAEEWTSVARILVLQNLRKPQKNRDWGAVTDVLEKKALPDLPATPILRAEVLVAQNRADQAFDQLKQARDQRPQQVELWTALAALAGRRTRLDEAKAILAEAREKLGDGVALRLAEARYLALRSGAQAAEPLRKLERGTANLPQDEVRKLLYDLGAIHFGLGQYADARRLWNEVARREPSELGVRLFLFDIALANNDLAAMSSLLEDIARIEGAQRGALWRYGQAAQHVARARKGDTRQLPEARRLLREAAVRRPAWTRIPLLESEIDELEGNTHGAVEHYLVAIDLGERGPRVIRRAVQLLYQRQRFLDADQVLRKFEASTPFSPELGKLAAEVSQRVPDFNRAVDLATKAVEKSQDYRDYIWLGQLLESLSRTEEKKDLAVQRVKEAEAWLDCAIELADTSPATWVAMVQFLVRTGQTDRIDQTIADAKRKIPAEAAPLALAQCFEAIGRTQDAEKEYQRALAASPNDVAVLRVASDFYMRRGLPSKAEPHLERLIGPELKVEQSDEAWARRSLALALSVYGDYQRFERALALIDRNLQSKTVAPEDRRAKAVLLAGQSNRRDRRQAVALFEQFSREPSFSVSDRFILARLYQAEGDWPKARGQMQRLLAAKPEPEYVASYIRSLASRGEVREAELWLRQLERADPPKPFLTLDAKSRILVANNERNADDEVIAAIGDFVRAQGATADEPAARLVQCAALLEGLSQAKPGGKVSPAQPRLLAEAERMLRDYTAGHPEHELALAAFLGRQGRTDESLSILERCAPSAEPRMFAAAAIGVAGQGRANAAQSQRAVRMLEQIAKSHKDAAEPLICLADLYNFRGDYDLAEQGYRRVLAVDPKNVVAMNNLALLVALRKGKSSEALLLANKAVALAGPNAALLDSRGTVYLTRGDNAKAVRDLTESLADTPSSTAWFHLAQARAKEKDREGARKAFKSAKDMGLSPVSLHPLERGAFQSLQAELATPAL